MPHTKRGASASKHAGFCNPSTLGCQNASIGWHCCVKLANQALIHWSILTYEDNNGKECNHPHCYPSNAKIYDCRICLCYCQPKIEDQNWYLHRSCRESDEDFSEPSRQKCIWEVFLWDVSNVLSPPETSPNAWINRSSKREHLTIMSITIS